MKQRMYISPLVYANQDDYDVLLQTLEPLYVLNTQNTGMEVYTFLKLLLEQKHIDITNQKVLDVGCNIGTFSFLLQEYNALHVTGIDIQHFFINFCIHNQQQLHKTNMLFHQQDFFHSSMLFKKYDIIFFIYSFLYLLEPNMDLHDSVDMFRKYIYSKPSKYIVFGHWIGGINNYKFDVAKSIIEEKYDKKKQYQQDSSIFILYERI